MPMEVRIEKRSDGSYIAYNPDSEKFGIIGTGETVSAAKEDFFNSIEEIKDVLRENNEEIPVGLLGDPMFYFDISSLFEYFNMINVGAFARSIGINDSLMRQYKRGDTYISDSQLNKIETGIHQIGQELTELKLM